MLRKNRGIFIMEILIVVAVIGIGLSTLLSTSVFYLKISDSIRQNIQANNLAQEAVEAVRSFRDGTTWDSDGLGVLSTGESNPYYPRLDTGVNPPKWVLDSGTETTNNFNRKIILEKVSRNPTSNNIEASYNLLNDDPDTRKVIAIISWQGKELEITTYFTNWK